MYPLVKLWLESSIVKQDFCDHHNVSHHCLNYWIKKYNNETPPVKSPTMSFSIKYSDCKSKGQNLLLINYIYIINVQNNVLQCLYNPCVL